MKKIGIIAAGTLGVAACIVIGMNRNGLYFNPGTRQAHPAMQKRAGFLPAEQQEKSIGAQETLKPPYQIRTQESPFAATGQAVQIGQTAVAGAPQPAGSVRLTRAPRQRGSSMPPAPPVLPLPGTGKDESGKETPAEVWSPPEIKGIIAGNGARNYAILGGDTGQLVVAAGMRTKWGTVTAVYPDEVILTREDGKTETLTYDMASGSSVRKQPAAADKGGK